MKIRIYDTGEHWTIEFSSGVQTFALDYEADNKESAEWMANQLTTAFLKFKETEIKKFADWLKKYRGIREHTTPEFQVRKYLKDLKI